MNTQSIFLLVEDNEDDVFFMQRAFQQAGVHNPLHVVRNGEEAIEYLSGQNGFSDRQEHPLPDLIFLDLKMPGVNGFEVLKWMRAQSVKPPRAAKSSAVKPPRGKCIGTSPGFGFMPLKSKTDEIMFTSAP